MCCPASNNQIENELDNKPLVNFSLDGVQESKSSSASLDTFCIRFKKCRNIYPIKLIRPNEKFKYDEQQELANVINDLNTCVVIDTAVCDNPKRSKLRMAKSCCGTHGCEYCEEPAISFKDNTMTRKQLTWPPTTMNGRPRTITGIRRIVNSIEEADYELPKNYLKGIKGRSVLLDQDNFDLILDLPTEYMHLVCLGNVKKMLAFTYKLGKDNNRVPKRKRCDPKLFNDIMKNIKVVFEFSRRCRNLDIGVYKAQEYRNVLLFFFPIIVQNIPEINKRERQLWLTLVFMVRSCVIPNAEFDNVSKDTIVSACELYYNLYFELFGQRNCTYSIHTVGSHLMKVRGNVPLTERSAFCFESFYSEMKNMFKAGTSSPLKQILQNTYMKRLLEHHVCEKNIVYKEAKENNTTLENNSLIYTYTNNKHELYVITSIDNDVFYCKRQGKFEFKSSLLPNYDWKSVGVYRCGPIGSENFIIPKAEVQGKVLKVLDKLITCPRNVLNEQ